MTIHKGTIEELHEMCQKKGVPPVVMVPLEFENKHDNLEDTLSQIGAMAMGKAGDLIQKREEIPPALFVYTGDMKLMLIPMGHFEQDPIVMAQTILPSLLSEVNALGAVMVVESTIAPCSPEKSVLYMDTPVEDMPDSMDAIALFFMGPDIHFTMVVPFETSDKGVRLDAPFSRKDTIFKDIPGVLREIQNRQTAS